MIIVVRNRDNFSSPFFLLLLTKISTLGEYRKHRTKFIPTAISTYGGC